MIELVSALEYGFVQRALMAGVLVATLCATVGVFVVLRGMSMLGDGLGHIAFSGVAIGLVAGVYPLGLALVFAMAGAVVIHLLQARGVVRGDTGIGILFSAGLAIGVLVVSRGGGFNVDVMSYLFGSLVAVSTTDLWMVAAATLVLGLLLLLLYKELVYVTLSEEAARVSGVPVAWLNVAFAALTGAAVVVAARVVGVLLVSALIVVPAATSLQIARSFRRAILTSVGFGVLAVLVGLEASLAWDAATGGAIALTSILLFIVVAGAKAVVTRRAP